MKSVLKYCFVSFLLFAAELHAQTINYTLAIRNSDCNDSNNGFAEVNVIQDHPPYFYLWNDGSTGKFIKDLVPGDYSVIVRDTLGNDTLIAVRIIELPCEIAPAIVFTPNGDEINDTWSISNIQYYSDNLILVYNRWGQKVYEHSGEYEPWNGKDMFGVPVPDNSYCYIIYGNRKDEKSIIKGTVSILR
jgi:gliding motility-associated-like protein